MQNFSKISLKAATSCPHWQLLVLTRAMQIKSAFQALMKWRAKEKIPLVLNTKLLHGFGCLSVCSLCISYLTTGSGMASRLAGTCTPFSHSCLQGSESTQKSSGPSWAESGSFMAVMKSVRNTFTEEEKKNARRSCDWLGFTKVGLGPIEKGFLDPESFFNIVSYCKMAHVYMYTTEHQ